MNIPLDRTSCHYTYDHFAVNILLISIYIIFIMPTYAMNWIEHTKCQCEHEYVSAYYLTKKGFEALLSLRILIKLYIHVFFHRIFSHFLSHSYSGSHSPVCYCARFFYLCVFFVFFFLALSVLFIYISISQQFFFTSTSILYSRCYYH